MADNEFVPITIDPVALTDSYLDKKDWRTHENSTSNYSIGGLILHQSGAVSAQYWLNKVYNKDIANAHRSCDFHIHDLSFLGSYCAGWSIRTIIEEGVNGVKGKIESGPPKHLSSAMLQLVNYLGIMQNEWAGAQALNGFDTYLAPFIRKDNMTIDQVKQCIQYFCYGVNIPSRWGSQSPFSNVTCDLIVPDDLKDQYPSIGGRKQSFTYGELQNEINMFNIAFFEVFEAGDYNGNIFQYPILTLNCTPDFFEKLDPKVEELLYKITDKFGTPYFSNYVGTGEDPSTIRSMCCRLRLSLTELTKKNGSVFGAGENTGSVGVVTLNMPKIGYLSHTENELFSRIDALISLAKDSLELKREQLNIWFDNNMFPYTKRFLTAKYENHFSTIGLVGMNELCRNYFRNIKKKDWDISTKEGSLLSLKILDYMRQKCSDFQVETGHLYNLESTPAESTCYRLAKHDKLKYPDILTAGSIQRPYYTNSSNLPVGFSENPWDVIKHQELQQQKYTGGTVCHIFLNESIQDWKKIKTFIKKIMYNTKLPYITISPTFSFCSIHGYLNGDTGGVCPKCKEETLKSYNEKLIDLKSKKEQLLQDKTIVNENTN